MLLLYICILLFFIYVVHPPFSITVNPSTFICYLLIYLFSNFVLNHKIIVVIWLDFIYAVLFYFFCALSLPPLSFSFSCARDLPVLLAFTRFKFIQPTTTKTTTIKKIEENSPFFNFVKRSYIKKSQENKKFAFISSSSTEISIRRTRSC